jgi:hypothetical protein
MNYDLNSSRSLLKPYWGENDKTLNLEEIKIISKPTSVKKPFQGINVNSHKESIQREIRRVTFKLKMSKTKVFEILKEKLGVSGVELENLYFFSLRRKVIISKKRK